MHPWTQKYLSKLDGLKYISIIDKNGYALVFPVIQAQALNSHESYSLHLSFLNFLGNTTRATDGHLWEVL